MRGGATLFAAAAAGAIAACSSQGKLEVRPVGNRTAAAPVAVPAKIAEGHAQLALGNAGLALELFRKALREDPASAEANAGIAMCYDRMNRFDLSRRYYEAALAIAPADARLLERLALSLDRQGARAEAAEVRREIAMRQGQALAASPSKLVAQAVEAPAVVAPVAPMVAEVAAPEAAAPALGVGPAPVASAPVRAAMAVPAPPKIAEPVRPPAAAAPKVAPPPAAVPLTATALLAAVVPAPRPGPVAPAAVARPAPAPVPVPMPAIAEKPAPAPAPLPAIAEKPAPARLAAPAAPEPAPVLAAAVAPHAPAASVTVSLPEARPAPPAPPAARAAVKPVPAPVPVEPTPAPVAIAAAIPTVEELAPVPRASNASPRLERMSPAEVTLVTKGVPQWRPHVVAKTAQSTTIRFVPLKSAGQAVANVQLLNAARHRGLAARTRQYLAAKGWRRLAIGDAPETRETSVIYYPESRRRTAEILAAQFRIRVARRVAEGSGIVMLLGRDAARSRVGGRNA